MVTLHPGPRRSHPLQLQGPPGWPRLHAVICCCFRSASPPAQTPSGLLLLTFAYVFLLIAAAHKHLIPNDIT